jgi:hypothetical protein
MSNQTESFRAILQNDSKLLATWNEVSTKLVADAAAKGVTITPENMMELSAIRLHVLTGDDSFLADWEAQAKQSLPAWKKIEQERELIQAIGDREHAKHEAAQTHLASMTPEEKMRHARSNNLGQKAAPAVERPSTPEAEAAAIAECERFSGGARIAAARRLGLL